MGRNQLALASFAALLGLSQVQGGVASSTRGAECFEYGYDYSGYDVQQVPFVAAPSICMDECASARGCVFWTYDIQSRVCYLKSAGAFTERRPADKMISGPRQCTFTPYCFEVGVDYYGHDIDKVEGRYIMTPMDCQRLCTGNPQCAFFSWKFSSHSCFLKSSSAIMNRREDPDVTSGPRVCSSGGISPPVPSDYPTAFDPATAPPPCVEPGVEYRGYNLRTTKVKSAAACYAACQQMRDCRYWTWSAQSRFCALKNADALNGKTQSQSTLDKVSGARDCIPVLPGCHYANVGIIGARLTSRNAASFEACQVYCASHAGCTHFSHDLLNAECTLWSSFNAYSQGNSTQGVVSGPAFCDAQDVCFEQSDYVGHNIDENETGEVESPAACQALCRKNADCHYWTWLRTNKGCYLKNENAVLGKTNDTTSLGRFSGPKWCSVSFGCISINAAYTGTMFHQEETEDYKACGEACNGNTFCTAWTYHSGLGFCSLFSGNAALAHMPVRGAISGDRECVEKDQEEENCFEEGIMYSLENIVKVSDAQTVAECYAACQRTKDCDWWTLKNGEQCYLLKSSDPSDPQPPAFIFDPNSISGPRLCTDNSIQHTKGNTFASQPLATTHTYTLAGCADQCRRTSQCHFWAFKLGAAENNCELYDAKAEQDPNGEVAEYGELLPAVFVSTGCTFSNPLNSLNVDSPMECQKACQTFAECKGWQAKAGPPQSSTVPATVCTLFKTGDVPIKVRDANTVCGTKILPEQICLGKTHNPGSDTDFSVEPATMEECASVCGADPDCKTWKWHKMECKNIPDNLVDVDSSTDESMKGAIYGQIGSRAAPVLLLDTSYSAPGQAETSWGRNFRLASGFRNRLLGRNSSSTLADCIQSCTRDATCTAWTWKSSCEIFHTAVMGTAEAGAISGSRFVPWANMAMGQGYSTSDAAEQYPSTDDMPMTLLECAKKAEEVESGKCWSFDSTKGSEVCYVFAEAACSSGTTEQANFISGEIKSTSKRGTAPKLDVEPPFPDSSEENSNSSPEAPQDYYDIP